MAGPDFLVVGHVVKDIVPEGWRLGGTVTYAALQAARLGLSAAVVTTAAADLDLGALTAEALVHCTASERSTVFRNVYSPQEDAKYVRSEARPLSIEDVPSEWRAAPTVLLGPVLSEVAPEMASIFPDALVGVSAQGWLRSVGPDQRVIPQSWPESSAWDRCRVILASEQDLAGDDSLPGRWAESFPVVAITRESWGARVYYGGRWRHIAAFPQQVVDPTGAGDVFAAAFMVVLSETGDPAKAARFASAAASISVGVEGPTGSPTRSEIEARLASHPEVVLT
jgi:sugar/nucleoside kinase (ribokinase family)